VEQHSLHGSTTEGEAKSQVGTETSMATRTTGKRSRITAKSTTTSIVEGGAQVDTQSAVGGMSALSTPTTNLLSKAAVAKTKAPVVNGGKSETRRVKVMTPEAASDRVTSVPALIMDTDTRLQSFTSDTPIGPYLTHFKYVAKIQKWP
jgi:hypothetical protein